MYYSLHLYSETWPKDIWGLIDYEANDLIEYETNINKSGYIYRHKDNIVFSENEIKDNNYEKLFQITKNDSQIFLNFNKVEFDETQNISSVNNAWFLLKPEKMENQIIKYKINEGEIIKIGRITIRIKDIKYEGYKSDFCLNKISKNGTLTFSHNSNKEINLNDYNSNIKINEIVQIKSNQKELDFLRTDGNQTVVNNKPAKYKLSLKDKDINENNNNIREMNSENKKINENMIANDEKKNNSTKNKYCRICYMEENDSNENPLLNPCICSGSMKFIHYTCLKHWINNKCYSKIEINNDCSILKVKPVECELCKTKFPDLIIKNGNVFNISEFKPDYNNYFIFESLTLDKNKNKYNYVVSLGKNGKNKKIYVGREKESNVLFSDISVSRTHCIFKIENKKIYIYDNDSTFATLVLVQTPIIKMNENLDLYIQIGRTFFALNVINKNKSSFMCCNISEKTNDKYYFDQNEKQIFYNKEYTLLNLDNKNKDNIYNVNGNDDSFNINKVSENKNMTENKSIQGDSSINIKKIKIKKDKEKEDKIISIANNKGICPNYMDTERSNKDIIKNKSDDQSIDNKILINEDEKDVNNDNKSIKEINKDIYQSQSIYLDDDN